MPNSYAAEYFKRVKTEATTVVLSTTQNVKATSKAPVTTEMTTQGFTTKSYTTEKKKPITERPSSLPAESGKRWHRIFGSKFTTPHTKKSTIGEITERVSQNAHRNKIYHHRLHYIHHPPIMKTSRINDVNWNMWIAVIVSLSVVLVFLLLVLFRQVCKKRSGSYTRLDDLDVANKGMLWYQDEVE